MPGMEVVPALRDAIEARRNELGLSPTELADRAGVSNPGLLALRKGQKKQYQDRLTMPVEDALGWPRGTIRSILDGGAPPATSGPGATPNERWQRWRTVGQTSAYYYADLQAEPDDWKRLGAAIAKARGDQPLDVIAQEGGSITADEWTRIEQGELFPLPRLKANAICRALQWGPLSIDALLGGAEPIGHQEWMWVRPDGLLPEMIQILPDAVDHLDAELDELKARVSRLEDLLGVAVRRIHDLSTEALGPDDDEQQLPDASGVDR